MFIRIPIVATVDGNVVKSSDADDSYGMMVEIDHDNVDITEKLICPLTSLFAVPLESYDYLPAKIFILSFAFVMSLLS